MFRPYISPTCHLKGRYIARILAELYPDRMDRMTQTPIFFRVVGFEQAVELGTVRHLPRCVLHQVAQHASVEALAYFTIGITHLQLSAIYSKKQGFAMAFWRMEREDCSRLPRKK